LVKENETSSTAAEMRAMAEQAEAEAAEAEALAAAARARARAIQLRRQAQQVEDTQLDEAPSQEAGESQAAAEQSEIEPEDAQTPIVETDAEAAEAEKRDFDRQPDLPTSAGSELTTDRPAGQGSRRSRKLSTAAAVLAALVIIALSASSAWMMLQHRHATRQHRLAAEFSAAARQGVVTLTSLDFSNAKDGVQHILDNSTGSFKDDFGKMAGDFVKVVEQSKVVEHGTVQAVGVDLDSMTENSAVVLVASTSEVTNAAGAKQDPRTFRLIVTLTRDGDQLKMSKVEFVP
jgi:Mce-associated membrane protein